VNSKIDLRQAVMAGLEELVITFEGDTEKVAELITQFVTETPIGFSKLNQHVMAQRWQEAAFLIHSLKARYGYLGLRAVFADLTQWEGQMFNNPEDVNHTPWMAYFNSTNRVIINTLKATIYYSYRKQKNKLPLTGKRVLIAEADEVNLAVFSLFVQELGGSVIVAREGREAIRLARENTPDLIFIDIHLKAFSNNDIIRELRTLGFTKTIISVIVIASTNHLDSLSAGADDFLPKPASREAIRVTLLKYLT
jgi:CheY-like chemotaxis protein